MATKDPDGNCTYGVTRTATKWTEESGPKVMSLVNWPSDQYINIYVVRTFDYTKESAAAYATYPGTGGENGDYIFAGMIILETGMYLVIQGLLVLIGQDILCLMR